MFEYDWFESGWFESGWFGNGPKLEKGAHENTFVMSGKSLLRVRYMILIDLARNPTHTSIATILGQRAHRGRASYFLQSS
jgi:hypothetical protein